MPRTRIHVTHDRDGGWNVKKEGAEKASAHRDTKAEAIDRARDLAKNAGPSQVIIHKEDGTIQEERTYGGGDPFPPPG